jgi:hypothetical protein
MSLPSHRISLVSSVTKKPYADLRMQLRKGVHASSWRRQSTCCRAEGRIRCSASVVWYIKNQSSWRHISCARWRDFSLLLHMDRDGEKINLLYKYCRPPRTAAPHCSIPPVGSTRLLLPLFSHVEDEKFRISGGWHTHKWRSSTTSELPAAIATDYPRRSSKS